MPALKFAVLTKDGSQTVEVEQIDPLDTKYKVIHHKKQIALLYKNNSEWETLENTSLSIEDIYAIEKEIDMSIKS
ncbi:MAG: hypothetical protein ACOH2A_12600 [Sphingobacteriaceae bacterium]